VRQLLKTLIKENIDLNTKELMGHLIHLLCKTNSNFLPIKYEDGLQMFLKEKELGEEVRKAIKSDPKWQELPVSTIFE
jgi:hypothetical protein